LKPYVPDIGIGTKHFRNEFDTLTKLNHQNIVKVLGYCYETKKIPVTMPGGSKVFVDEICAALCLEYLDNGTLQKHLSGTGRALASWSIFNMPLQRILSSIYCI
jgi:serine/threonine protein kinase